VDFQIFHVANRSLDLSISSRDTLRVVSRVSSSRPGRSLLPRFHLLLGTRIRRAEDREMEITRGNVVDQQAG